MIVAALRLMLSLAIAGPAQAWPGQSSSTACAWSGGPTECEALTMVLVHKHALTHSHVRKTEHAAMPAAPTRLPAHDEDPLASMHFE
ncbi:hypothetical protein [Bradyrhizobium sp. Gha]|uniref:hypothetical protein n=1 Tax=Bradyrhizobium sp. Gha TaxID=1855318 RepID=UPI0011601317|nr:hypothetical protein [Bradyrhizobium sp. Gha]